MYTYEDLVAAPATPLVLEVLSEGESYGFAVLERVRELSGGQLDWPDAMVYPLFHRLHRLGYLTPEWRTMPDGRRRRYYAITDDGHAGLATSQRRWVGGRRGLSRSRGGPWQLLTAHGEIWACTVVAVAPRPDIRTMAR